MAEILMPPGGQTTNSSVITKWHRKEGDYIKRGDILFSIETDKATLDIESFAEGILIKQCYAEGAEAEAGAVVAIIETGKTVPAHTSVNAEKQSAEPVKTAATVQPAAPPPKTDGVKVLASPLAKNTARQNDIDIARVSAAGTVVKKSDILNYLNALQTKGGQNFAVIDINISALDGLLKGYAALYGKEAPSYIKYVDKAVAAAQKEFADISAFKIISANKTSADYLTVSAVFESKGSAEYNLGFIGKVKILMDNILLLLAM